MTGPEHYREAEKLLQDCGFNTAEDASAATSDAATSNYLAAAQVHATLALAAATAINDPDPNGTGQPDWATKEWEAAAFPDPLDTEDGPS
ncbi:hypothetical protein ACWER9_06650 [Micromonospora sp. NPDC003944]